ncbi:MAG: peptidase U32 family protein [Desulfomonilia bacterium]|nr:peptidase U32 family protein [Desulfomonilia bacterium]
MQNPEILAPAGSMETLETACLYGAEAVYLGLRGDTNLRSGARNFTPDELETAVSYAHARGVRVYLALNTYPHDEELVRFGEIISSAADIGVDALIVSDIGVLSKARKIAPSLPLHLSTQANAVNTHAINAWGELGVSRVILARELSEKEILYIREHSSVELEIFVHGSICISISGRCVISSYLCGRDANRGSCTQPCRWDYALLERTRQDQYMPVVEEDGYTYLYNSKDLCLLPVMSEVMGLGMDGLKIEGRNKTALYVATATRVYRSARDSFLKDPDGFTVQSEWLDEIGKISNREYFTGFFTGRPDASGMNYDFKGYTRTHHLAAKVLSVNGGETTFEARNPLIEGMELEWLPGSGFRQSFVLNGATAQGVPLKRIRPNEIFVMKTPFVPKPGELVRKPLSEGDKIVDRSV